MSTVPVTPAPNALETAASQSDYRAMREGKTPEKTQTEKTPAADAVQPTPETAAASGTAEPTEEQKQEAQKKTGIDKRFSELTGEIKSLKTQLAAKSAPGPTETTKPAAAAAPVLPPDPNDPEPDASKFTDYVEWQKQWNRWDRRQDQRQAAAAAVAEKQTAQQAKARTWQERVQAEIAEKPDFEAVAQDKDLPVSPAAAEAIVESDIGPKILYYLGQNRAEAERIVKLSPASQAREIGKIEAALQAENKAAEGDGEATPATEPPDKKIPVSKALPPHRPVGGAAAVSAVKNIDTMTQSEYRLYRETGKIR